MSGFSAAERREREDDEIVPYGTPPPGPEDEPPELPPAAAVERPPPGGFPLRRPLRFLGAGLAGLLAGTVIGGTVVAATGDGHHDRSWRPYHQEYWPRAPDYRPRGAENGPGAEEAPVRAPVVIPEE